MQPGLALHAYLYMYATAAHQAQHVKNSMSSTADAITFVNTLSDADTHTWHQQQQHHHHHHHHHLLTESLTQMILLSGKVCMWILQEYTDDTAELRKQLDALGGMAALQDPETQLLALQDLEQFVSAVGHLYSAVHLVHAF